MLLIAEIGLTIVGLILLIRGRTIGNDPFAHPHVRLLGGFMLTLLPMVFGGVIAFTVIWALMNPDATPEAFEEASYWPITGIEVGVVVTYVMIGNYWEKVIRRKIAAAAAQNTAT